MEIKVTKDIAQDLTILTVSGMVSAKEMNVALLDFYEKGPTSLLLWDMSQSDVGKIKASDLEAFAQLSTELGGQRKGGRTAVFAPADLQFGLARMSEILTENKSSPFELKVFRSRELAMDWLQGKREDEQVTSRA